MEGCRPLSASTTAANRFARCSADNSEIKVILDLVLSIDSIRAKVISDKQNLSN